MKKPIIGISTSQMYDKSGSFSGYKRNYVNQDYVDAVLKNGGIPVLIPFNTDLELTKEIIKIVDGLILSGGHDVFPKNYNEEPQMKLTEVFPERDEFDKVLYFEAKKRDIPILGICRGMQIINVFEGGTLYQDLSYRENTNKHSFELPKQRVHNMNTVKGTILNSIFGDSTYVNSFHHQVVKDLGKDLVISATADDKVVEGYEHKTAKFIVGVQFHPEMLIHDFDLANELFKKFINKC